VIVRILLALAVLVMVQGCARPYIEMAACRGGGKATHALPLPVVEYVVKTNAEYYIGTRIASWPDNDKSHAEKLYLASTTYGLSYAFITLKPVTLGATQGTELTVECVPSTSQTGESAVALLRYSNLWLAAIVQSRGQGGVTAPPRQEPVQPHIRVEPKKPAPTKKPPMRKSTDIDT
jgi:hypothetical protein